MMSVRFILGRSGTGKTALCMEEARRKIQEDPAGDPLIYLVPEHMTFGMEYAFAATPRFGGLTRLNVYSFPRLALRVLQQQGGITRLHLDDTGIAMILRKIVRQHSTRFRVFHKAAEQSGFFELLAQTLTEFKRYCLNPEQVSEQAARLNGAPGDNQAAGDKLHDLALVYQEFNQTLSGKYVDGDDYLKLMCEKIPDTAFLQKAEIWVDGFQTMTPEEQMVVECLMETSTRLTIVAGCDRIYDRAPDQFSPFRHPALLYLNLKERAEALSVKLEPTLLKTKILRSSSAALKNINTAFGHFSREPLQETEGLKLTEAVNRREEVEQAARQLMMLVRDKNYRFREMTVLVRHLKDYRDLIETLFSDYGIPVFIDQKKSMHHHPLIECVRSALEIFRQNWRYEPVFRCIKTDLFLPTGAPVEPEREAFDRLENYVMAYGISGRKRWTASDPWDYQKYRGLEENKRPATLEEQEIRNALHRTRLLIAEPLSAFEQALRAAKTVKAQCTAVYDFLIKLAAPEKLTRLARSAEQGNRLEEAREHRQAWDALIGLLDQCAEGAGDEAMSFELFCDVLDTGLDQLEFAQVPPALDQVQVSSIDHLRAADWKAVLILGINEGVIPAKPVQQGLFSDEDRSLLEDEGLHLADGDEEQMAAENEWIYRALTLPSKHLFLSYPLASEEGDALKASPLVGRIKRLFPQLKTAIAPSEPRGLDEAAQLAFINHPRKAISSLATQIRDWQRGYPISDIWWDTFNWLTAHNEWQVLGQKILSSLFAMNNEQLSTHAARELYGESIRGSVSRLELFNACPFSQFASYGLKLRDRDVYQLAAPDIGQLFHLAIKRMTEQIMKSKQDWADLSPEACDELAETTVKNLAPQLQRQILSSTSRYKYLQHKLEQVVARVAQVMRKQAASSHFVPISLELPFGPGQPIPPLTYQLKNGCSMQIVGRIDRVDKAEEQGRLMLRIIDYKSSSRDLNLNDVYYGLALQMLTYLDVVITYSKDWLGKEAEPAGVLYFHVHNPFLNLSEKMSSEAIANELFKDFKMKGLLLEDPDALLLMDQNGTGKRSIIAPFGVKKNGELYKDSKVATAEAFTALRDYTQKKMEQAGRQITDGNISIAPYRMKQRVPCNLCPFRPVCQFDQSQPGSSYRDLPQRPDDWLLQKIEEEAGTDDAGKTD